MNDEHRIACVGGAGAMGAMAARLLAAAGTDVLVLDLDRERGEALAAENDHITFRPFDVTADRLAPHLDGIDVVVNTLGPFSTHGLSVLRQTIAAAVNYVDINDDWQPTLAALDLDDEARLHGATALVGMGASPGISNVLAMRAVAELDRVDTLYTGWTLSAAADETGTAFDPDRPSAAALHLVDQATGTIRIHDGGRPTDVAPMQRYDLDYPGIGPIPVCTVGHPEAVTLPRTIPGLKRCVNVMSGPAWWLDGIAALMASVDRGDRTPAEAAIALQQPSEPPADTGPDVDAPGLWAAAYGTRGGEPRAVSVSLQRVPPGGMAGVTAVPAVVAAQMITEGAIDRPGVVTPEEVLTVDDLLPRLEPHFSLPAPSGAMITIVVAADSPDA